MTGAESADAALQPIAVARLGEHEHPFGSRGTPPGGAGAQRPAGGERHPGEMRDHLAERLAWPLEGELPKLGAIAEAHPAHACGKLAGGRSVVERHRPSVVVAADRARAGDDGVQLVTGSVWLGVDRHSTANLPAWGRHDPPL